MYSSFFIFLTTACTRSSWSCVCFSWVAIYLYFKSI